MCTYTTHVRVCYICRGEDTVLISEKLCPQAEASGVFGGCLQGPAYQRDQSHHQCWKCMESVGRMCIAGSTGSRPRTRTRRIGPIH
ncbi:hypothetical protein QBC46DRAFT_381064 [Diplogelasinospora grovesii]|uniref:Uncharacterized protein n=1 Tax=Diplogelasinospora grovesii TaxID=303347 RepID=A0AAN6ND65_9PEZI|nr:hypothetical protein QBC46DRAFT_381064 [Diplogelasinospora grovesii]